MVLILLVNFVFNESVNVSSNENLNAIYNESWENSFPRFIYIKFYGSCSVRELVYVPKKPKSLELSLINAGPVARMFPSMLMS